MPRRHLPPALRAEKQALRVDQRVVPMVSTTVVVTEE